MSKDTKEFLTMTLFILGMFGAMLIIVGSIEVGEYYIFKRPACIQYGFMTGQEVVSIAELGCLVKYKDNWVSIDVATKHKSEIDLKQSDKVK